MRRQRGSSWLAKACALAGAGRREPLPPPGSAAERALLTRLARAYETCDIDGLVALLADDVPLDMPPAPLEYQGRALAARFLGAVAFQPGTSVRLRWARANRQPAFGMYRRTPPDASFRAVGVMVVTLSGTQISRITGSTPACCPGSDSRQRSRRTKRRRAVDADD